MQGAILFDLGFGPEMPALAHNAAKLNFKLNHVDALVFKTSLNCQTHILALGSHYSNTLYIVLFKIENPQYLVYFLLFRMVRAQCPYP